MKFPGQAGSTLAGSLLSIYSQTSCPAMPLTRSRLLACLRLEHDAAAHHLPPVLHGVGQRWGAGPRVG